MSVKIVATEGRGNTATSDQDEARQESFRPDRYQITKIPGAVSYQTPRALRRPDDLESSALVGLRRNALFLQRTSIHSSSALGLGCPELARRAST